MCSLCGKEIAYHGGTTNLRNHLLYKHPLIYSPKDKTGKGLGKKQSNVDTVVKARVCSEAKTKEITNCNLNLICMDIQPVRMNVLSNCCLTWSQDILFLLGNTLQSC